MFNKYISVEFLLNKSHFYISGPNLPLRLDALAMVTSPSGKGVIVMGGHKNSGKNSKAMFELTQSMQWARLKQTLKIEHDYRVAKANLDFHSTMSIIMRV